VGAVSEEVAREMACGVREAFATDIGLSTTGIAGPGGGNASKPVGLIYTAVAYHSRVEVRKLMFGENREVNKQRSAQAAMELVRRFLLSLAM
jgi:nicotinamide-nucleotide amidase